MDQVSKIPYKSLNGQTDLSDQNDLTRLNDYPTPIIRPNNLVSLSFNPSPVVIMQQPNSTPVANSVRVNVNTGRSGICCKICCCDCTYMCCIYFIVLIVAIIIIIRISASYNQDYISL